MKVGDYVRTKHLGGSIEKIIEIIPKEKTEDLVKRYITDISKVYMQSITEEQIIKSSSNIIDLIEVGDYVNGDKVVNFMLNNNLRAGVIVDSSHYGYDFDEIKSIVTKEQFENCMYKVGD